MVENRTDMGRTVFARRRFEQGEIVAEYQGTFIPAAEWRAQLERAEALGNCFLFHILFNGRWCGVDAFSENESKGRLINHSLTLQNVTPTVRVNGEGKPRILFKAKKTIMPGDELFYDYGERSKTALEKFPWLRT